MDLFDAIAKRHSYRGPFTEAHVPRDDLRRIIDAGLLAPSGKNLQTTSFVVVDDPESIRRIADILGHSPKHATRHATAVICCLIDRTPEPCYAGADFQVEDCAAAVENILLAITALGYATVWIDGELRAEERAEAIAALLGVPDEKVVRVLLPVGVPAESRHQPPKKPFEERAWFNRYGSDVH